MLYSVHGRERIRIPKQKRSIEKKQRIKDAAMKLMSEKGYHQTSSNEIAKEAGVSIGTFYSYFKDKKELYAELVADIYAVVLTTVEAVIHDTMFHNNGRNKKAVMEELTDMIVNYLFVSGDQMGDG
ncbi:MAG TPA: hypothetical protein DCW41_02750 [Clostridiales bacterium]|nr:hypothetical protein [Clostridiales bacterium]